MHFLIIAFFAVLIGLWVVTVAAYFGGPYLSAAMH